MLLLFYIHVQCRNAGNVNMAGYKALNIMITSLYL